MLDYSCRRNATMTHMQRCTKHVEWLRKHGICRGDEQRADDISLLINVANAATKAVESYALRWSVGYSHDHIDAMRDLKKSCDELMKELPE